ncbi:hypothetical protein EIP91_004920 [Steccherinum ochraceum]|uniref:Uncharacterized protein n=1 Tax=Steccherinum ochraceum TaxID=92696 RepID=A0A4R0RE45_9APHY|nr:hypothetical protein EIP91_004920 [Steccherinum ochraceum]
MPPFLHIVERIIARYRRRGLLYASFFEDMQRNDLRQLVREIIRECLCAIAGRQLQMSYTVFGWKIRTCRKFDIYGWPADIPFKNPGTLPPNDLLRLIAGWRRGSIYFFRIPPAVFTPAERPTQKTRCDFGEFRNALTPKTVPEEYLAEEAAADEIEDFQAETEVGGVVDEIEQFSD